MRGVTVASALLVAGGAVACGGETEAERVQTLQVYAASSLTAAFTDLEADFETSREGVDVQLTFGGSSDLAAQIDQGAPADVFASADESTMASLVAAGLTAGDPTVFATNTLQIAVPPDNPGGVRTLADLAGGDVQLVTCAPEVPCGAAAQALAERVGVALRPVSEEQSVTDVLNKVATGEADAGLVYVTDVAAAGDDVHGLEVPEAAEVVNDYPLARLVDADSQRLAQDFVDLVLSDEGQGTLRRLGFGPA